MFLDEVSEKKVNSGTGRVDIEQYLSNVKKTKVSMRVLLENINLKGKKIIGELILSF